MPRGTNAYAMSYPSDLEDENDRSYIDRGPLPLWAWPAPKLKNSFDLEDLMSDRIFDSPVFVKVGKSFIEEIACLEDALEFLYEWPKNRRDLLYETARRACQNAFESDYPLSAARQAFCAFAQSVDILEDVSAPLPWMRGTKPGQGGGVTA